MIKTEAKPRPSAKARPGATVSLARRAYLEIRNQILKGELPVGITLARRKLAGALDINVPPVGEALHQLEREGLVGSKPSTLLIDSAGPLQKAHFLLANYRCKSPGFSGTPASSNSWMEDVNVVNALVLNGLSKPAGTYNSGNTALITGSGSIQVIPEPAPVAGFSGTPTRGVEPLPVTFTDSSSGSITNWVWNLGDGVSVTNGSNASVNHTYAAGTYTVSLTANGYGGAYTSTKVNYIVVSSAVNTNPATLNFKAVQVGNTLQLTWAPDHKGWQLYTNSVGLSATGSWFPVPGSAAVTNETINVDSSKTNVFFQPRYP